MITSPILIGYNAIDVTIECTITNGLPSLAIVGLATKSVEESKERIRAAIIASGYSFPKKRIVINLAPADIQKNSASLDAAIALAILHADKQVKCSQEIVAIGELGLDGTIRSARGIIGLLRKQRQSDAIVFYPEPNESQVIPLQIPNALPTKNLRAVVEHLNQNKPIQTLPKSHNPASNESSLDTIDFAEIIGQQAAKRALTIAAAGGHNILLSGPPGTGKSMLAKAFIGVLPSLSLEESLDTTHIHSLVGTDTASLITMPPLRSPHHTSSSVSLIGGGHSLRPGEISLAHNGVLFLDEIPEFPRSVIDALRQPMEDNVVTISRAQATTEYPSNFILMATSNPCPCGYYGTKKNCSCSANDILRYQKKLSGPILDRIDIHFSVTTVDHEHLLQRSTQKESPAIKQIVQKARAKQIKRSKKLNAHLSNKELKESLAIDKKAEEFLNEAAKRMNISARSYMKTIKLSRTIADISDEQTITVQHITEALQYRLRVTTL